MLYAINGKYYVNIAPSVYIEVFVTNNGDIQSTLNKLEIDNNTVVKQVTINEILNKFENKKDVSGDTTQTIEIQSRRNRHKR